MNFKLTGIGALFALALSACDEAPTILQGATSQGTAPAESEVVMAAPAGTIDVHAQWPMAFEVVDVPISDNLYRANYVLVIDTSGSMNDECDEETKLETAKTAATDFIGQIPADAAVGLVKFGGSAELVIPLGTNQHQIVADAVRGLKADGGTPMAGGISAAYQELLRGGSAQLGYGTHAMAVLGDGAPQNSTDTIRNIDSLVQRTRVEVTTIGFCTDLERVMNREGVSYFSAFNLSDLAAAFKAVLAEAEVFDDISF